MIKLYSPAKINLFLNIIGRNEKNYHILQSLIAFIDFYDEIEISEDENLTINFDINLIDNQNNLINQAIQYFSEISTIQPKLQIKVKKNIPLGAGLGGGSSNAATILKFLQKYYNYYLKPDLEKEIALKLGSDVVAFLYKKPILVEGIGEIITPVQIDLSEYYVLIIYPEIINNSGVIYKKNRAPFSRAISTKTMDINWLKQQKNDLIQAALDDDNKIKNLLEILANNENALFNRLSGSGSTCYAVFNNIKFANQQLRQIRKLFPTYLTRICKFINDQ